jgi:putative DNA methylase
MTSYPKRLIEVDLPIKQISEHARREKHIRQGHISAMHIWWARRPLAACRAVLCAALWPDPVDEHCPQAFRDEAARILCDFAEKVCIDPAILRLSHSHWSRWHRTTPSSLNPKLSQCWPDMRYALLDFIADFANWDASTISIFLETARDLTQAAYESLGGIPGTQALVVDPFAGGGSFPLEALRVGTNAVAADLNPIAVLLNKVTLEYIPRYGQRLIDEVRKWGEWIKVQANHELGEFYPNDSDGATPIVYLWARTITCEGPGCGVEVPIIKNQVLSSRKGFEAAVKIGYEDKTLKMYVITGIDALKISGGTSRRSSVTCPACGFTTPRKHVEIQANDKGFGYHMYAICIREPNGQRVYRCPNSRDITILDRADQALAKWYQADFNGISAIPKEELPYLRSIFNVRVYGIDRWYKLYHRRQLLSAIIFTSIVRKAAIEVRQSVKEIAFASAIAECLALSVSQFLQYSCDIATYLTEGVKSAFIQGQSLPMKMDFVEANPLMEDLAGGYNYSLMQHLSGLDYLASFPYASGTAQQVSALQKFLPNDSIDLLVTDPPYYDVVPYVVM